MLALDVGIGSDPYKVVLLLHILVSIVGFGGVLLNGIYATLAQRRPTVEGRAISEANYTISMIAEKFIYAVPLTGILLVGISDGAWSFGDLWLWLSLAFFLVAMAVSVTIVMPNHRKINQLLAETEGADPAAGPPPQLAAIQRLSKQQGPAGALLHVSLVAILVLMVWKPGN